MEECDVPGLSSFPAQKYEFERRVITKMELLILHTLDWKMASITPFAYLEFFIDKLSGRPEGRDLFQDAMELVFAASKGECSFHLVICYILNCVFSMENDESKLNILPASMSMYFLLNSYNDLSLFCETKRV